jgi:hypothetical protein
MPETVVSFYNTACGQTMLSLLKQTKISLSADEQRGDLGVHVQMYALNDHFTAENCSKYNIFLVANHWYQKLEPENFWY